VKLLNPMMKLVKLILLLLLITITISKSDYKVISNSSTSSNITLIL